MDDSRERYEEKLEELQERVSTLEASRAKLKKTKRELEKNYRFVQAIVDTIPDPLLILDANLRIVSASNVFYRKFRITPEETEGQLIYEIGNRQWDIPELRELLEDVLTNNTSFENFEVKHDFEKIGRRIMLLNARRIYQGEDKAEFILLVIEDVTEKKRMEKEREKLLEEIGERYKELNLLYKVSRLGSQEDISLETILQKTADLIPSAWYYPEITCARIVIRDKEFKTENFKKTKWRQSADIKVHEERIGTIEVYYLEERPQLDEGPFLKEERDLINGLSRMLGNMIERERVKKILQDSEKKYRDIVENAHEGIWVIDNKADTTFVNQHMADMLGYTKKEMLNQSLFSFMDEESEEFARRLFERRKKGMKEQHDFKFIRKDGTHIFTNVSTAPIRDDNGKFLGAVAFVTDITNRKMAGERVKVKSQKTPEIFSGNYPGSGIHY